ncbi:hypothetical protein Tco_0717876 [Tanacetum coccineum]
MKRFITSNKKVMRHYIKHGKAYHSQKWHDESRRTSNGCSDGIEAMTIKLDGLGKDMKKLEENVHVIQVGCGIYEGAHLDKDFPLNEEVKRIKEVKYG